jgi:hypothetical protein
MPRRAFTPQSKSTVTAVDARDRLGARPLSHNVKNLHVAWIFQTHVRESLETSPIVVDGVAAMRIASARGESGSAARNIFSGVFGTIGVDRQGVSQRSRSTSAIWPEEAMIHA